VKIVSFSYRLGAPKIVDMRIDCRVLPNPHSDPALRHLNGLDPKVQAYVKEAVETEDLVQRGYLAACHGKTVGFGCIGGKHRSVVLAELLGAKLRSEGRDVTVEHWVINSDFYLSQTDHSDTL
jgi:UPF0042 nucleotide-binding protein